MAFLTKEEFCLRVEREFSKQQNLHPDDNSIIDSIIQVCDQEGIDSALVKPFINRSLREKVAYEAGKTGRLKRNHTSVSILDFV